MGKEYQLLDCMNKCEYISEYRVGNLIGKFY